MDVGVAVGVLVRRAFACDVAVAVGVRVCVAVGVDVERALLKVSVTATDPESNGLLIDLNLNRWARLGQDAHCASVLNVLAGFENSSESSSKLSKYAGLKQGLIRIATSASYLSHLI